MEFFFILLCMIVQKGHSESLGEADPQFSSPSRIKIFEDDTSKETVAEDRMDPGNISGIDPALLQAVLADPVLLQAVDPRVLQAVLVSAAAANLAIPNIPSLQVTTPVPVFPTSPKLLQQGPPKLGHPFTNVRDQNREPFPEKPRNVFAERPQNTQNQFRPQEQQKLGSAFKAVPSLSHQAQNTFQQPKLSQNTNIFGEFDPQKQNTNIQLNSDVEFIVEDFSGNKAEKLLFENQRTVQVELPNLPNPQQFERQVENPVQSKSTLPLGFTSQELLKTLQENPAVARQLAEQMQTDPSIAKSLGLTFGQPAQPKLSANLVLPPQPSARQVLPPPGPQAGVCSLITRNGIPCDPGLAFNPSTGSCEWPDMLIEAGCNPEVVTGFGPCPQDATDPHLNPSQILSWPYPKFPVNLDIVTVQNFDAALAKKYFIVCVPTIYGKLFPRLICCPDHQYFDPFHVDGCVYDHHPHHPPPAQPGYLPPPTFGNPDPFITHVGAPLPPGTFGGFSAISRRSDNQPAIEFMEEDLTT